MLCSPRLALIALSESMILILLLLMFVLLSAILSMRLVLNRRLLLLAIIRIICGAHLVGTPVCPTGLNLLLSEEAITLG